MKKAIFMLLIAIFFVNIFPIVTSQEKAEQTEKPLTTNSNPLKDDLAKEREFAEIKREKLQNTDIKEEELDIFRALEKDKLQIVMGLNEEKIFKFAELQEAQISKLSEIDINGLRKILSLDKETIDKLTSLDKSQLEKLSALDRARIKRISELDKKSLINELQKIEIETTDSKLQFKKRILVEQKIIKEEERFQIAEQNLLKLKKELDTEIALLKLAQEKNDEKAVKEHSKNYLLRAADAIINHLEKIKSRVQQSQNIGEEEALGLVRDINLKIRDLEDIKSNAEDAEAKEEIRWAAKTINAAWKRIRIKSEFYVSILVNRKIQETIERSEQLEKKMESILTELEEKDNDIKNLEEQLTKFSVRIDEARIKFRLSQEKFREAQFTGIKKDLEMLIIEAKSLSKEARALLKDSHNIIKEIIKEIRVLDRTIGLEKQRKGEQITIKEEEEAENLNIQIEGFLKISQQNLLNSLIKNLNQTRTNTEIKIELKIEDQNLELKKEIKGALTKTQKDLINQLTESLETTDDKIIITIESENEVAK